MKVNIFRIPEAEVEPLRAKLTASQMEGIKTVQQEGWTGTFYFSTNPTPTPVRWAEIFGEYFEGVDAPTNRNYYAAFVFTKGSQCYATSYGKAHFYLRPFCDYDFGIEVAKRIADEADIRQTASRRFQGKRKKDIRSFAYNTRLDVESGESVDYLQAAMVDDHRETFGKIGKFGASVLLTPDIPVSDIGRFLGTLDAEVAKPATFSLPRTTVISEPEEIERYDNMLIEELTSEIGTTDFTHNSYDLYGVDFVFSSEGRFTLSCPGCRRQTVDRLDMRIVKLYIADNGIPRENLLRIKVRHEPEDGPGYTKGIKESLDFIADDDRVLLANGRWMHFNQDYLDFLDNFLREIAAEEVEPEFRQIAITEPLFNTPDEVGRAGYAVADKNFDIFRTRASTPIEAWDLLKGSRVYAVKFGTAQKLGYVCDQASAISSCCATRPESKRYRISRATASGSATAARSSLRTLLAQAQSSSSRRSRPGLDGLAIWV